MIKMFTRLDDGIYESEGGGETILKQKWSPTNKINLGRAVRRLRREQAQNEISFGNIGCGKSWLEVDGKEPSEEEYEKYAERGWY